MHHLMVVDSHSIGHALKSMRNIRRLIADGNNTGVIYSFIRKVISLARTHNPDDIVFTWDGGRKVRRDIFEDYSNKKRAEKTPEEKVIDNCAFDQFNTLRTEVLPMLGFENNFLVKHYEADDIIASIVYGYSDKHDITMITNDKDMLQLLDDNVYMYNHVKKELITKDNFVEEYGIQPEDWAMVKAIAGCRTDEVPGVERVGEVTAIKFIKGELKDTTQAFKNIVNSYPIIERNTKLVVLPFYGTPCFDIELHERRSLRNFIEMCEKFAFKSLLNGKTFADVKKYLHFRG